MSTEISLEAKLALARAVGAMSRLSGRGGTSAPGKLLVRLQPDAIGALGARLPLGSVLVSATNGKTTTSALLAGILERAGIPIVHNRTGANMAGGIASSLLDSAGTRQRIRGDLGLFEVDEAWLPRVARELRPRAMLLSNLFRDQLDRYGELEALADGWAAVLGEPGLARTELVLNADDPLVADLPRGPEGERRAALYFGMEDPSLEMPGMSDAADAKHCRRCGAPYVFDAIYLGHLGHYRCESCGQGRPDPSVVGSDVRLEGVRRARFKLRTPAGSTEIGLGLPGLYNVYNALGAAAMATALEIPLEQIRAGLEGARPAFGRAETVRVRAAGGGCRELQILLVKNPAGANEVLRTLALEPGRHEVLGILNDRIADGRDVSWIWDADFNLLEGRVARFTCAGTRAAELGLRLKYAGIEPELIEVRPDLGQALELAASAGEGTLYALPTYTGMLALRELLVSRGEADSSWR